MHNDIHHHKYIDLQKEISKKDEAITLNSVITNFTRVEAGGKNE
jgi:hypothetical protein